MIPLFLLKNPMLTLRFGLYAVAICTIGILIWRIHYLAEKSDLQSLELKRYEQNFNELTRLSSLRENIITENLTASLNNETLLFNRLNIIESINNENDCGVSPVLRDAIDRLYSSDNSP